MATEVELLEQLETQRTALLTKHAKELAELDERRDGLRQSQMDALKQQAAALGYSRREPVPPSPAAPAVKPASQVKVIPAARTTDGWPRNHKGLRQNLSSQPQVVRNIDGVLA